MDPDLLALILRQMVVNVPHMLNVMLDAVLHEGVLLLEDLLILIFFFVLFNRQEFLSLKVMQFILNRLSPPGHIPVLLYIIQRKNVNYFCVVHSQ